MELPEPTLRVVWQVDTFGIDVCDLMHALRFLAGPDTVLCLADPEAEEELPFTGLPDFAPGELPWEVRHARRVLYLPFSASLLAECAEFLENHAEIELASHVFIFQQGCLTAAMYDFASDPLIAADWVPEETIARIAAALGRRYRKVRWS